MIHISKKSISRRFMKAVNDKKHFDELDSTEKSELRESLLREQHYLCAYCMRSLNNDHRVVKIEHYVPRKHDMSLEMAYSNLLAVCYGNEGMPTENQTCDKKKKEQLLTINPQNKIHMQTISYSKEGMIYSSDEELDKELNDVLNLNYCGLVDSRANTLASFLKNLNKKYRGKHLKKDDWKKLENKFCNIVEGEKAAPYCGIIWHYIRKKV